MLEDLEALIQHKDKYMKIDFATYTDEKLKHWIWTFEQIPMVKLLYDKDGLTLYQEALYESLSRDISIN